MKKRKAILKYIKKYGVITPEQALEKLNISDLPKAILTSFSLDEIPFVVNKVYGLSNWDRHYIENVVGCYKRKPQTQKDDIIIYMLKYGSISPIEAFPIGVTKLATRISEMQTDPRYKYIPIVKKDEDGINKKGRKVRYKRYSIGE